MTVSSTTAGERILKRKWISPEGGATVGMRKETSVVNHQQKGATGAEVEATIDLLVTERVVVIGMVAAPKDLAPPRNATSPRKRCSSDRSKKFRGSSSKPNNKKKSLTERTAPSF